MRWTQTFIPTLKETPAEAEIVSHKLLLRAGLIRKLTGGLYTFLPLGLRALRKVEQIVREEMNRAGALEVLMPALQPPDIWQQSGRYESAKDVLFKVRDRAKKEWVLGPTHEEVITTLVAGEINSYRQMPKNFYQIQTKFRDEIRPRFGLMRAKEFIMKDAYSFDATDEAAQASYRKMYDAYTRIFQRCGLKTIAGRGRHRRDGRQVLARVHGAGRDGRERGGLLRGVRLCGERREGDQPRCRRCRRPKSDRPDVGEVRHAGRGDHRGAEQGALQRGGRPPDQDAGVSRRQQAGADPAARRRPVERGQAGRRAGHGELPARRGGGDLRRAGRASRAAWARSGVTQAAGLRRRSACATPPDMTTGANADGFHLRHVAIGRDIQVDALGGPAPGAGGRALPQVRQAAQDPARHRGRPRLQARHQVQRGAATRCSSTRPGKQQPAIMGCYGIGVTRTLQAVIEQSHDDNGIIWPISVAPYTVCITPLNVAPESAVMQRAEQIYADLTARGVDVILDDRNDRPGVKFKDSELVGFPIRVGIGEKSLAKGEVEIKPRGGA